MERSEKGNEEAKVNVAANLACLCPLRLLLPW